MEMEMEKRHIFLENFLIFKIKYLTTEHLVNYFSVFKATICPSRREVVDKMLNHVLF